jgi:hypothetical protein
VVGTPDAFKSSGIRRSESPLDRWRWIFRTTEAATAGGRASRTPLAHLIASASLVRCAMSRRSNCANVERPALFLRLGHQGGEVEHRARQPVELRDDKRRCLASL